MSRFLGWASLFSGLLGEFGSDGIDIEEDIVVEACAGGWWGVGCVDEVFCTYGSGVVGGVAGVGFICFPVFLLCDVLVLFPKEAEEAFALLRGLLFELFPGSIEFVDELALALVVLIRVL